MIDSELAEFIHGGVAAIVATCDAELRPQISRGWGPAVSSDGLNLALCVEGPGTRTTENLEANGAIAVTLSIPTTYRTVQVKGTATDVAPPSPQQRDRMRDHLAAFGAETERVGLPAERSRRLVQRELVAVTLQVEEIYDQTPGPNAGRRL